MPLITTLIPAYKPDYLDEVFLGLRRQTLQDFRVILSDDSPDDGIARRIHEGHWRELTDGLNLQVVRGPKNARLNHQSLIERWNGSSALVHMHLDDDVVFPDFYRRHAQLHASGSWSVSVSPRWLSHGDSRPAQGLPLPELVTQSPLHVVPVHAGELYATTVAVFENWLGEFSNMVMSARGARCWPRPPAQGLNHYGLMDLGFMLAAADEAPLAFLREPLGVFRHHPAQSSHGLAHHSGRVALLSWTTNALNGWHRGLLDDRQAVQAISRNVRSCLQCFGENDPLMNRFFDLVQHQGTGLEALYQAYVPFWQALLRSHPSTRPADAQAPALDGVPA